MIVDASVLLMVSLREFPPGHAMLRDALARAADEEGLRAPYLVTYEMGQAIHGRRKDEAGHSTSERQARLLTTLATVQRLPSGALDLELSAEMTETGALSFYDATYVAHARARGEPLATGDRRMAEAAVLVGVKTFLLPGDLKALEEHYPKPDTAT